MFCLMFCIRTMPVFWLLLAVGACGQPEPGATALITRLAQEAKSFERLAPQVTAQETLLQKAIQSRSDKLKKRMLENYFEQGLSVAPWILPN